MSFEEWLESDAVVNNFGHVINFSNTAVEFARAAWLASREAAQHGVQADLPIVCDNCFVRRASGDLCENCGSPNTASR